MKIGKLPREYAAKIFILIAFIDAAGRGFFLAGAALFYTQVVGLTNVQVGVGIALAGGVGLVCTIPIGLLADKIGAPHTLIGLQLWRATGFLIYPFVTDFQLFLIVACLIGVVEQAVGPVIQSIAGSIANKDSFVETMSMVAVIRNVAYTLSAGTVAIIVTLSTSKSAIMGLLLVNAAAFIISAILIQRARLPNYRSLEKKRVSTLSTRLFPFRDVKFLSLSFLNGILSLHIPILTIALPLWILTKTDAPKSFVGIIFVINTLMAVTLQLRFSKGGDNLECAGRKQGYAGIALSLFCLLVTLTPNENPLFSGILLISCTVLLTIGELWQSAGAWGLSYGLSPASERIYYMSVYAIGSTAMMVIGPGLLPILVVDKGVTGWVGLACIFAFSGIVVSFLTKHISKEAKPVPISASGNAINLESRSN